MLDAKGAFELDLVLEKLKDLGVFGKVTLEPWGEPALLFALAAACELKKRPRIVTTLEVEVATLTSGVIGLRAKLRYPSMSGIYMVELGSSRVEIGNVCTYMLHGALVEDAAAKLVEGLQKDCLQLRDWSVSCD